MIGYKAIPFELLVNQLNGIINKTTEAGMLGQGSKVESCRTENPCQPLHVNEKSVELWPEQSAKAR
jgi:hypothetical protein